MSELRNPPVNSRATCPAVCVQDIPEELPERVDGAWHFYGRYGQPELGNIGIMFVCPCGCKREMSVGFRPYGARPSWEYNGKQECPSLTPSINILQFDVEGKQVGEHWHGHLTDGVWKVA